MTVRAWTNPVLKGELHISKWEEKGGYILLFEVMLEMFTKAMKVSIAPEN